MSKLTLIDAVNLAIRLHGRQADKLGEPYLGHLVRVMLRLPADATESEKIAALLHDAIEDVPDASLLLAEANVPSRIVEMVEILTRMNGEDYFAYVKRVAASPARRIKRADLQDNIDKKRLSRLPERTAERLHAKYTRALQIIDQEGEQNG